MHARITFATAAAALLVPALGAGALAPSPPGDPAPVSAMTTTFRGVPMDSPRPLAPALLVIRESGARVSAELRRRAEERLERLRRRIDEEAADRGDEIVVERLSGAIGARPELLIEQRNRLVVGWGNLLIAHLLASRAASGVGVSQLFTLHHQGVGWGQIAAGLGVDLEKLVRVAKAEARVALGAARPDHRIERLDDDGSAREGRSS